jgi:uncharacterized peroxidase-related enzyme
MARLDIPGRDNVPEDSREILNSVHDRLGFVPNLFRLLGSSPAVLQGFTALNDSLAEILDIKLRERIGLAVAEVNGCDYSLSSHNYLALNVARVYPEEIELARKGTSNNPKTSIAVSFAAKVARERGHVSDADVREVQRAGYADAEIVGIVAVVAVSILTNFLNEVAQTEIDFPALHCSD